MTHCRRTSFEILSNEAHHRDPFDRMLVSQALEHDLTIVTVDAILSKYPVPLLPAV